MNTKAIEAGAAALREWLEGYTKDFYEQITFDILEAARPHLETEIRVKIAAEIRDAKKTGLTRTEAYGWHNNALDKAAHIAEGKP